MTLYLLSVGVGFLAFTGVSVATGSPANRAHVIFGLQLAVVTGVVFLVAVSIYLHVDRVLRLQPTKRLPADQRRSIITEVAMLACGTAIIVVGAQDAITPASGARNSASNNLAVTRRENDAALRAGATLFQERGCIQCHLPDGTGVAPTLLGLLGRPVDATACGPATVDESYVRESILNPSVMVVTGYEPIMPSFAGRLTEGELQALIAYVTSSSVPDHRRERRP